LAFFGVINITHLSRTSNDATALSRNSLYACSSLRRPDFAMALPGPQAALAIAAVLTIIKAILPPHPFPG